MADVLTPKQRSYCMSQIKDRDTKPELIVRRLVHRLGYRFRLHSNFLLGKPDIVFQGKKKVVFVHGCFWHRHQCRYGRVRAKTNTDFWEKKITGNVERDRGVRRELRKLGWDVLVVWECQTRAKRRKWLIDKLKSFLDDTQSN